MKLGLSSYTYTWAIGVPGSLPDRPVTAFGLIDRAFSAGLNLIQIADNLPLEELADDDLTAIREYALKRDV
jgi:aryl-alcohol dehydrogenase-like predicted oxidoreductase